MPKPVTPQQERAAGPDRKRSEQPRQKRESAMARRRRRRREGCRRSRRNRWCGRRRGQRRRGLPHAKAARVDIRERIGNRRRRRLTCWLRRTLDEWRLRRRPSGCWRRSRFRRRRTADRRRFRFWRLLLRLRSGCGRLIRRTRHGAAKAEILQSARTYRVRGGRRRLLGERRHGGKRERCRQQCIPPACNRSHPLPLCTLIRANFPRRDRHMPVVRSAFKHSLNELERNPSSNGRRPGPARRRPLPRSRPCPRR